MTMFLDADEMADLTGYKQASKQIAQLKQQKIPFHINAAGHPKVARAILEGQRATVEKPKAATWSPSWAANRVPT
jgi:hypothetical protein